MRALSRRIVRVLALTAIATSVGSFTWGLVGAVDLGQAIGLLFLGSILLLAGLILLGLVVLLREDAFHRYSD